MYNKLNLIGQKYGKLKVVSSVDSKNNKTRWHCLCDCGNKCIVFTSYLRSGRTKSCGCLRKKPKNYQLPRYKYVKHGHCLNGTKSKTYRNWQLMIYRCDNPKNKDYQYYGARGIKVCSSWYDFQNFLNDMGEAPSQKHNIHRINNDGNYEKENCRWTTLHFHIRNTRKRIDNTSGYVGVVYNKATKKWYSSVTINKKKVRLGTYENKKDALIARNKYIIENSLDKIGYKIQEYIEI